MRVLLFVPFVTLLFAVPSLQATSVADVAQFMQAGKKTVRVACFGDSITGVYYHSGSQRAWTDMLGLALQKVYPNAKLEMINAGISGHTTVNALARIEKDVLSKKPHLVVVMFGMNDITGVKPEDFQKNLNTIADKCAGVGAAVVLCTPNSVYENTARPNSGLLGLSKRVHQVGQERKLPVVDCFQAWQDIRVQDELQWMLMMSDAIHPNMHGHIKFAELVAGKISGKVVSLGDVPPPEDALRTTFNRLNKKVPIKLVAMPPYDTLMPTALKKQFPDAKFEVTPWPIAGQTVAEMREWAKRIRGMKPNLVVVAVPASATDKSQGDTIRNYEWVLNWSFHFGSRPWDVVPVLPAVTGAVKDSEQKNVGLARHLIRGKDVQFVERRAGDERTTQQLLADWVAVQKKRWMSGQSEE